ncbi:hypothetical protein JR316_0000471 [Psilocybe cubensis]|uniref:F-box domain-containing protein n=2 Tax=Psilocybe cubensis TaxID=181762 RepID=A0A8H8CQA5_PSICU|nr:hypothetical protein JR316_0000471 [Psilocybe cubensis]KAH9486407.1 hypothetical protein JR316_0000471 [Psilocybe cubensis]
MLSLDFHLLDLATNNLFSDDVRATLHRQRKSALDDLALLDAELALAQLSLQDNNILSEHSKRQTRRKLVSLIAACDIAIAPHKSLPTELLSYIFILAYSCFPTDLPPPSRTSTPLVLCQTCSRWRTVALDTPDLWADVVFRYEKGLDPRRTVLLAKMFFARCGSLKPLSLQISRWSGPDFPDDHQTIMENILRSLVIPYASRFWRLHLRLSESTIYTFLSIAPQLSFPCLKSIHLECDNSSSTRGPSLRKLFPANSPLLTKLGLSNFRYQLQVDDAFFPWKQLTHLYCHDTPISIPKIHALLRLCRSLVECLLSVDTRNDPSDFDISKARIRLISLQKLSLIFTTQGPLLGSFLEPLYTPNIKELTISNSIRTQRPHPQDELLALLTRACHTLEVLQIDNIPLPPHTVAEIAHALPTLTALLIGADNLVPRDVLGAIAAGAVLPRLRCLACSVDDLEAAIRALEYRWQAGVDRLAPGELYSPPFNFILDYTGQVINHDQAVRVDRLRANGVDITMTRVQP